MILKEGRGIIQITGRANYHAYSMAFDLDNDLDEDLDDNEESKQ